jgi:alpha-2-macroglobulin-like protein
MRTTHLPKIAGALLALTAVSHTGRISAEDAKALDRLKTVTQAVQDQLASIGGKEMYLLTDKPLYHPGETVWFRAWELSVKTLEGLPGEHGITFQLLDPRGAKIAEKRVLYQSGMATNDFDLQAGIVGGPYTLRAISDAGLTEDRPITVSAYELPRVKKTLELGRKSYAAGEEVTAKILLQSATGEALHVAKATAVVLIDGNEVARIPIIVDWNGKGFVRFQLPKAMTKGDGLLTLLVDAGGVTESMQKRIPIVLDRVDLAAFPEGGDLVTGLASRVYLSAHDTLGKPAEFGGTVVDDQGSMVARFKSFYGGMVRFPLTPEKGRRYTVRLFEPTQQTIELPAAKPSGCTLQAIDDYRSADADLKIRASCTEGQKILATAVLRERLLSHAVADIAPGGAAEIALSLPRGSVGAVRVTLFDTRQAPLAERLVFRGLGEELHIALTADRASYAPRDKVTLTVKTTDARGKPVPADVALSVVDDTVLNYAGDKTGNMLAQLYLEPEMPGQSIHEPNFYFSGDFKAPEAMDLLLGTQGWRRFEWKWVNRGAVAQ